MNQLSTSIESFAREFVTLDELALDKPWAWQSYDSEGIRFAFFRTFEGLREVGVRIESARQAAGNPSTQAQRLLSHYQAAFRDLQAVLLGIPAQDMDREPAEGQWSLRNTLAHLTGADTGFCVLVTHALELHRKGAWQPGEIPDEVWGRVIGLSSTAYRELLEGPAEALFQFLNERHTRTLQELAGLSDAELELPSSYWENETYPLRFRLGRFESHMRQHTIQMEKTRLALNLNFTEPQRLIRLIYLALAQVEGVLIGAVDCEPALLQTAAVEIDNRTSEISAILRAS